MDGLKKLVKYEVKGYLEECGMEYEDLCSRIGGKYVYNCEDSLGEECGGIVGVEYEDGVCEVVGCRYDRVCSFEDMLSVVWGSL